MPKYLVKYKVRKLGSIGSPQTISVKVEAKNESDAVKSVGEKLRLDGLDTVYPVHITENKE